MINAFLAATAKHVVAESTNLGGTNYAKHIFNVLASADIDNGKLVNLDDAQYLQNKDLVKNAGLILGAVGKNTVNGADKFSNGEVLSMVAPTATSRVGLILSVPVGPDERPFAATLESNFYNGKGEVMRVYDLMMGDRFTVSANGISGTPTVGKYVVADEYDIKVADGVSKPTNAFYGEIIQEINRGVAGKFYKILVRKNGTD